MHKSRYIIGIDLGTTNCVVAYVDTNKSTAKATKNYRKSRNSYEIEIFDVIQIARSGEVAKFSQLPSFIYHPTKIEIDKSDLSVPWTKNNSYIVGLWAREKGALVPGRLVSSAKSWLCNSAVDRRAKILPWDAPEGVKKLSPVTATTRFLEHIKDAWNYKFADETSSNLFEEQEIVLTVPASFDNSARELTVEAAENAGLQNFVLIEEPQSAFYSWLYRSQESWKDQVYVGELILVCDIGGGTTDFSLIQVEKNDGKLGFTRISVGEHLMLGGDNIDLALAAHIEQKMLTGKQKLDTSQWLMLQAVCRNAKEEILSSDNLSSKKVTIPGRTSKIVGGALSADLTRQDIEKIVLDGFLPVNSIEDTPKQKSEFGLQEFGLPYAAEPAITKHLAAFLKNPEVQDKLAFRRPHKILFNGGVFKSEFIQKRVYETLKRWFPEKAIKKTRGRPRKNAPSKLDVELLTVDAKDLDNAVATGAVYFGLGRRGEGIKITSGSAQSYYIGVDSSTKEEINAICICPQGLAEGEDVNLENHHFELTLNQPVSFPMYSSRVRPLDDQGDIIRVNPETVNQLPPICTVLKIQQDVDKSKNSKQKYITKTVKVNLHIKLTDVGILETWCVTKDGKNKWKLQLDIRGKDEVDGEDKSASASIDEDEIIDSALLEQALKLIEQTFSEIQLRADGNNHPNKLMKNLENLLNRKRADWSISTLRKLFEPMLKFSSKREINPLIEVRWLNLAGYLLRPGFGSPLDDWRINEIWKIFDEDIFHQRNLQVRSERWILWRRIAAGLSKPQQLRIYEKIAPVLLPKSKTAKKKGKAKIHASAQEEIEMWRTIASLEKIHASEKRRLGEYLLSLIEEGNPPAQAFWAIGRFGARVLFNAPIDTVISKSIAESWINRLLKCKINNNSEALFAIAQLTRMTGDRTLDINEDLRNKVIKIIESADKKFDFSTMINKIGHLKIEEQARIFGEALPPALKLIKK